MSASTYLFFLGGLAAFGGVAAVLAGDVGLGVFAFVGAAITVGGGLRVRNRGM